MNLIAIDLDGTLLSDDGTISPVNREAIQKAERQHNIVAVSSGRSLHDIQHILHNADLACPIIAGNGALIYYSDNIIKQFTIPVDKLRDITSKIERHHLHYEIYINKGVLIKESGRDLLRGEIQQIGQASHQDASHNKIDTQYNQHGLIYVTDYHDIDYSSLDPYKVFIMSFDRDALASIRYELNELTDISMTTSGSEKLEVGHHCANKGYSLKYLADYLEIPLDKVAAIGDNFNDIPMLLTAGTSIAMGNADAEVQKQATFVTDYYHNNGVAKALEQYLAD